MDKKEIRERLFAIRMKIELLSPEDKKNLSHPFYRELQETKHELARLKTLETEREMKENGEHKRK